MIFGTWIWFSVTIPVQGQDAPRPFLEVEPSRIDIGEVLDTQRVQHDVLLYNKGLAPLVVSNIVLSCEACLSAILSEDRIAPGDAAILSVQFDALGYDGPVAQWVALETSDPTTPKLVVPVSATVVPRMGMRGGPLFFQDLGRDETHAISVELSPRAPLEAPAVRAASSHPGFTAKLSEPNRRGAYVLTVTTAPPQPETGFIRARIGLFAEGAEEPFYAVPLLAQVTPPFHVAPQRLVLRPVDGEQLRIVFIRQRTDDPVRILKVEVPKEHFSREIFPDASLSNYRINVYGKGLVGQNGPMGHVVIETDRASIGVVQIPVIVEDAAKGRKKGAENIPPPGREPACQNEAKEQGPGRPVGGYLEQAGSLVTP